MAEAPPFAQNLVRYISPDGKLPSLLTGFDFAGIRAQGTFLDIAESTKEIDTFTPTDPIAQKLFISINNSPTVNAAGLLPMEGQFNIQNVIRFRALQHSQRELKLFLIGARASKENCERFINNSYNQNLLNRIAKQFQDSVQALNELDLDKEATLIVGCQIAARYLWFVNNLVGDDGSRGFKNLVADHPNSLVTNPGYSKLVVSAQTLNQILNRASPAPSA